MSEVNSSPVSLPAGSYDYDALKSATDKAAKGAVSKYDTNMSAALEGASANVFKPVDPRETPGYVMKPVKREDLGITETIQVYDPRLGEKIAEEGDGAIPTPEAQNRRVAAEAVSAEAANASPKE